ncbi:MAG: hypothetical protein FJW30_01935 [Acidobacteria bacterium]|nr:hypothetical protein [Acidobacteriota bacterium]
MEPTGNLQVAYCRICGKSLAPEEQHPALGTIYCAEHVPAPAPPPPADSPWITPATAPPPNPNTSGVSPGLAFILGLIPGVGAIYNAQYAKGLIHVLVFGLLLSMANSDSVGDLQFLFGMLAPAWVFYMAFEAYHTARRRELGQPVEEFSSILSQQSAGGVPVGPILLIGMGVVFLLNNLGVLRLSVIFKFWPLALIGLGVHMLYQRTQERSQSSNENVSGGIHHER